MNKLNANELMPKASSFSFATLLFHLIYWFRTCFPTRLKPLNASPVIYSSKDLMELYFYCNGGALTWHHVAVIISMLIHEIEWDTKNENVSYCFKKNASSGIKAV